MDVISDLIRQIKLQIPVQIIDRVFSPRAISSIRTAPALGFNMAQSIEAALHDKIIEGRLRPDLDIVGGSVLDISLVNLPFQYLDSPDSLEDRYNVLYQIPKSYTNGREITGVHSLIYGINSQIGSSAYSQGSWPYGSGTGTVVQNQMQGMLNAMSPVPVSQSAQTTLVGPNTVLINDWVPLLRNSYMRVMVGYDSQFTAIPRKYWLALSKLAVMATKAWIYNNYLLEMGENELRYGSELGDFRRIVEGYADMNDLYIEYLETQWKKRAFLADTKSAQGHYRMLLSAGQ